MIRYFRRLSFGKKILSSYILFISISCLLVFIYYIKSMEVTKQENYNNMFQLGEQISLNTDILVSNMDRIRFIHLIDDKIKPVIRSENKNKEIDRLLEEQEYIERAIKHMANMNQFILRVTIVNEYGDIYSNVSTEQEEYLKRLAPVVESQDWTDKNKVYYTGVNTEKISQNPYKIVTSISKMYDIDRQCIGTIYIDLNYTQISTLFNHLFERKEMKTAFLVLDTQEELMYASPNIREGFWEQMDQNERENLHNACQDEEVLGGKKRITLTLDGEKCSATAEENNITNWKVVVYTPLRAVYADGIRNMIGILTAMAVVLSLAIVLGIILSRQISRPVTILAKAMAGADKGSVELIQEEPYFWQDEMGQLMHSYNEMGQRINESIEKIYVYQLNQKQTELKMLQFQINPHFLYNTLNTISSIAALEDIEEIVQISDSLSNMFQYNIKGSDIVPMSHEIQHVKNYLNIHTIRFPEKYQFHYEIQPEAMQCYMLKFLIQPLVENSLQHAFTKLKDENQIRLHIFLSGDSDIFIEIWDNGVGIKEEDVTMLNTELSGMDTRTLVSNVDRGIGLRNVNARIKNFYGRAYGLQIESMEEQYTVIRLKIRRMDTPV
ncbi:sensor histidine kinase [uncultured Robinsoniella sp.]|uniref:cache domain-containing sensor histidine kinase n=1 Tax=uncultured Robinsoniella sp. TaxID=904190 RepID=UPI00374E39CC